MGTWVFQQEKKNQKMPGAHKIGAAVFGPRIAGGKITDTMIFLITSEAVLPGNAVFSRRCASN